MIVLTWLGSGFAFAIGICIGAYLMRWLCGRDGEAARKATLHYADVARIMRRRNDLLEEQNAILAGKGGEA